MIWEKLIIIAIKVNWIPNKIYLICIYENAISVAEISTIDASIVEEKNSISIIDIKMYKVVPFY